MKCFSGLLDLYIRDPSRRSSFSINTITVILFQNVVISFLCVYILIFHFIETFGFKLNFYSYIWVLFETENFFLYIKDSDRWLFQIFINGWVIVIREERLQHKGFMVRDTLLYPKEEVSSLTQKRNGLSITL